jgi:hypothetical protein
MPATTVSPRQQRFIASLAEERVTTAHEGAVNAAQHGLLTSRQASNLISDLLSAPRRAGAEANRARRNTVAMNTPTDTTRAGRMLLAGGIEATVTLENGEHITLQVRSRKPQGRGWTNCNPTDDGARINIRAFGRKCGWINVDDGVWNVTVPSRNTELRAAVNALFTYASGEPTNLRVQEASRCGRCMRPLTDPVSIARGIGPECYGRGTGSRAARIEAGVEGPNGPTMAQADAEIARREAQHDAAFAAREREQERAAFASDPDYRAHDIDVTLRADTSIAREALETAAEALTTPAPTQSLSSLAAVAASPVLSRDQQKARDLISEALDAYCGDTDRDFAMRIFDQLAAR